MIPSWGMYQEMDTCKGISPQKPGYRVSLGIKMMVVGGMRKGEEDCGKDQEGAGAELEGLRDGCTSQQSPVELEHPRGLGV